MSQEFPHAVRRHGFVLEWFGPEGWPQTNESTTRIEIPDVGTVTLAPDRVTIDWSRSQQPSCFGLQVFVLGNRAVRAGRNRGTKFVLSCEITPDYAHLVHIRQQTS